MYPIASQLWKLRTLYAPPFGSGEEPRLSKLNFVKSECQKSNQVACISLNFLQFYSGCTAITSEGVQARNAVSPLANSSEAKPCSDRHIT